MKWKIGLVIAIVAGGLAGSWLKNLPGFVLIAYDKTSIEMRLWVAIAFILMALILILFCLGLLRSFLNSANRVRGWQGNRNWRKARKKSIAGMLAYSEGHWKEAEKAMSEAADASDNKLINYLIAAQAAQQQNAEVRRDAYLRSAFQAEPAAKVAIGLTQAQLQIQQGQLEQALASLNELKANNPTHPFVLKLLAQLYQQLKDWQLLIELIPSLKKFNVFDSDTIDQMEQISVSHLLKQKAKKADLEGLKDCWLNLTSSARKSHQAIYDYAELLVGFNQMDEAEPLVKQLIKKQVSADVLALYGKIMSSNPTKQLSFLESWQQANPAAPREVFLTMGKLAFYASLWGKARSYLEQALQIKPNADAFLMMAKTLTNLGDEQHADACYRQGLEYVTGNLSQLNQPLLAQGSEDLVQAGLLPKFEKL
jgi:HemY protein